MKMLFLAVLVAGLAFTGCGQKEVAAPKPPPPHAGALPALGSTQAAPPPPNAAPLASAAAAAAPDAPTYEGKDEAEKLTKALHDYYTRNGANAPLVSTLDALVKAGLIKSVPAAPTGMKYVVDTKTVTVRLEKQ